MRLCLARETTMRLGRGALAQTKSRKTRFFVLEVPPYPLHRPLRGRSFGVSGPKDTDVFCKGSEVNFDLLSDVFKRSKRLKTY